MAGLDPDERARISQELRHRAVLAIWQQVDERGIGDPLEQAELVLRRRYPELPEAWFEDVLAKSAAEHAAGRWTGFERP